MQSKRKMKGYTFDWDEQNEMYNCRGEVCHDEEHDEIPDPELWEATVALAVLLEREGFTAVPEYSEKGWQEVQVENPKH